MTEYIHWAKAEFELDRRYIYDPAEWYIYDPAESKRFFKPFGLWFEANGDWQRWCEAENFRLNQLNIAYQVEFQPHDVVFLRDALDIDRFTEHYAPPSLGNPFADRFYLNWPQVAEDYSGIVIAPYCWSRRMTEHTLWYYGWDCASGCIWDLSILTRFERITRPATLPEKEE